MVRLNGLVNRGQRFMGLVMKYFMRTIGPCMITGANVLIAGVVYSFLFHIIPDLCDGNMALFTFHVVLGFYLLGNIMFNYMACINTPPGFPEPCADPGFYLGVRTVNTHDGKRVTHLKHKLLLEPGVSYRWCRHCNCIKPPRAHHDSILGRCVLDMDHYCPWMHNCIGYGNYRYFVLFMAYLLLGCIYVVATDIILFYEFNDKEGKDVLYYQQLQDALMYSFTIAIAAGLAVGILLLWHVYLSLTNQTTIEFYINMEERAEAKEAGTIYKNPFDKGWRKNLRRVFGEGSLCRLTLISLRKPPQHEWPALPDDSMHV